MNCRLLFVTLLTAASISCAAPQIKKPVQPKPGGGPAMRLGYTIIYVKDVTRTVKFYEQAFGLSRRFVHESG